MFKTGRVRHSRSAALAVIGALSVATIPAVVAAPMANPTQRPAVLVPLAADEGIRLGPVSADGDCVVELTKTPAPGQMERESQRLICVQ